MEEQAKFLAAVEDIKEIALSQQNYITQEEIRQYLGDMELSEEQLLAVCQYLGANKIQVEGYVYIPEAPVGKAAGGAAGKKKRNTGKRSESGGAAKKKTPEKLAGSKSVRNRQLYRRELEAMETLSAERHAELIKDFLLGRDQVRQKLVESYLKDVAAMSEQYKKYDVLQEDVIAEGNLALLAGVEILSSEREKYISQDGTVDTIAVGEMLLAQVKDAMEQYIDETTAAKDWEHTVAAKTNLLHEARKYMAEEIGRMPTTEELSEYTKLSRKEIHSLMRLSGES